MVVTFPVYERKINILWVILQIFVQRIVKGVMFMSYDKLPPGLTAGNDFCLYKLEPDKNGKIQKVPYRVSGARADPGNVVHLTDFTTAYDACYLIQFNVA